MVMVGRMCLATVTRGYLHRLSPARFLLHTGVRRRRWRTRDRPDRVRGYFCTRPRPRYRRSMGSKTLLSTHTLSLGHVTHAQLVLPPDTSGPTTSGSFGSGAHDFCTAGARGIVFQEKSKRMARGGRRIYSQCQVRVSRVGRVGLDRVARFVSSS